MDATAFRWVLVGIAVMVVAAVYFLSQHQARLRKRNAMENFTRDEVDSTFDEDEQLHHELDNLNRILSDDREGDEADLEGISIETGDDASASVSSPLEPEVFVPALLTDRDATAVVSYHLRHDDYRSIAGEVASAAAEHAGLELNGAGYLEFRQEGEVLFRVASLSAPGTFNEIEQPGFATLGFNCFVDFEASGNPREAYESMLKKIDELVRVLNVKVFKPDQKLLTISDVTDVRERLD